MSPGHQTGDRSPKADTRRGRSGRTGFTTGANAAAAATAATLGLVQGRVPESVGAVGWSEGQALNRSNEGPSVRSRRSRL